MYMKLANCITNLLWEYTDEDIPDRWYHGTDGSFNVFDDTKPIFFVDDENIASTYGDVVIQVNLTVNNPIHLDFSGQSTYYFWDAWYLPSDLANKIKEISIDIEYGYSLDDDFKEYLESLDFSDMYGELDGILMHNISDAHDGVFSSHATATNCVVFDKSQIKVISKSQ